MEFSKLRLRGEAMREGAWFPLSDGWEVKLRATQAEEAKDAMEKELERRRKALGVRQGRELPNREIEAAMHSSVYGKLLIDWRGLTDNGEAIPCNEESFKRVCAADPSFVNRLFRLSSDEYLYDNVEEVERD